jgi:nicotinate-nucleotide adenylyltransferase
MTDRRLRIGLLGGTFNPIHCCHLSIAQSVLENVELDRMVFVPSGDPPHKTCEGLAPARHRVEMVRLAIAGTAAFSVSEVEIDRSSKSYSIDTIRLLRTVHGAECEQFFVIGLDAFLEIGSWKEASELIHSIHFVVISRPGSQFVSLSRIPILPRFDPQALAALDGEHERRMDVSLSSTTRLILLRLAPCNISASLIRDRLKHGQSVSNLLPAPVESYILQNNLYMEASNRPGI